MDGGITQVGGGEDLKPKKSKKSRTKWTNMLAEEGVNQADLDATTKIANYGGETIAGYDDIRLSRAVISDEVKAAIEEDKRERVVDRAAETMADRALLPDKKTIAEAEKLAEEILTTESAKPAVVEEYNAEEVTLESVIYESEVKNNPKIYRDIYQLLVVNREDDPRLRKFLEKIARHPYDATMLWVNRHKPFVTPDLIHSMLSIGSKVEYQMVYRINKYERERVFIYPVGKIDERGRVNSEIGAGMLNAIHNVYYAHEAEQNLMPALDKDFLPTSNILKNGEDPEIVYEMEKRMARYLKSVMDANLDDQSIRNVLYPILVGDNAFLMSKKVDKDGKSRDLGKVMEDALKEGGVDLALQKAATSLIGVFKGLNFLDKHGIVDTDVKPGNIIDTEYGGCLIDFGGFYKKEEIEYFVYNHNMVFQRNGFCNISILVGESSGYLKSGSTHRFALAKVLERMLLVFSGRGKEKVKSEGITTPDEPGLLLDDSKLPTENKRPFLELYDLYKKLHQSFKHPYRFFGNDFKNGLDHDYISDEEVIEALEKIANQQK